MNQSVIFLDIDGVLTNQATGYRYGDPDCVALLNMITDATGAAIVISSVRRSDPEIATLLASWGVTGEVIGVTPQLATERQSGIAVAVERGKEIASWIAENKFGGRFVILDDEADMGELRPRLVQTPTNLGLEHWKAVRAILRLVNCDTPCQQLLELTQCPCAHRAIEAAKLQPKLLPFPMQQRIDELGAEYYGNEWGEKRPQLAELFSKGAVKMVKELKVAEAEKLIKGLEKKLAEVNGAPK